MLSGETAKGDYPLEAVKTMAFICKDAEAAFPYRRYLHDAVRSTVRPTDMTLTVALAAVIAADNCHASAIILPTNSGRAVFPVHHTKPGGDFAADLDAKINFGIEFGKERGFINRGDFVVAVNGWKQGQFAIVRDDFTY
ncbi:pyruvate kinase, alpha/beta domain protein [Ancylostoma duodenale]|uniref:Pyruvate kinase, alpha/beta domain protein n=1 Tax=Ancylostoma duodenale TaxID=51022 RepID=A0A0C2GU94_9BILA|nr:pyruvate kinase, alpha/beta domain protein [Ancylostoma duodenale]